MTRSYEQIRKRLDERKPLDMLGFEWPIYANYLPYAWVKDLVKEGVTEENHTYKELDRDEILEIMEEYMEFAWEKANNCRGISANRSIKHFIAWIWLAGDDDLVKEVEHEYKNNYQYYGKDILKKICDYYGWDSSQWDDGVRTNVER